VGGAEVIDVEVHGGKRTEGKEEAQAKEKGWVYNVGNAGGWEACEDEFEGESFHAKPVPAHVHEDPLHPSWRVVLVPDPDPDVEARFAAMEARWKQNSPSKARQPQPKDEPKDGKWDTRTKIGEGEHPWEDPEAPKDPYEQKAFHANDLPHSTTEPRYANPVVRIQ
jgi:hypothetical protein